MNIKHLKLCPSLSKGLASVSGAFAVSSNSNSSSKNTKKGGGSTFQHSVRVLGSLGFPEYITVSERVGGC